MRLPNGFGNVSKLIITRIRNPFPPQFLSVKYILFGQRSIIQKYQRAINWGILLLIRTANLCMICHFHMTFARKITPNSLTCHNTRTVIPIPSKENHFLRKNFNHCGKSLLTIAGVSDKVIRKIVGHKGQNVTENVYTHFEIKELQEAIDQI